MAFLNFSIDEGAIASHMRSAPDHSCKLVGPPRCNNQPARACVLFATRTQKHKHSSLCTRAASHGNIAGPSKPTADLNAARRQFGQRLLDLLAISATQDSLCNAANPGQAGTSIQEEVYQLVLQARQSMQAHRDLSMMHTTMQRVQDTANKQRAAAGAATASTLSALMPASTSVAPALAPPAGERASTTTSSSSTCTSHPAAAPAAAGAAAESSDAWPAWSWGYVQHVCILGLGSLYEYRVRMQADAGAGSVGQSTRASARLYQTALASLLLPSALGAVPQDAQQQHSEEAPQPLVGVLGYGTAAGAASASTSCSAVQPVLNKAAHAEAEAMAVAVADASTCSLSTAGCCVAYDPVFLPEDVQLLARLGCNAFAAGIPLELSPMADNIPLQSNIQVSVASAGSEAGVSSIVASSCDPQDPRVAKVPTLFYMPQCSRELYESVIAANHSAGTLRNVAIWGNSLRGQADMAALMGAFGAPPKVRGQAGVSGPGGGASSTSSAASNPLSALLGAAGQGGRAAGQGGQRPMGLSKCTGSDSSSSAKSSSMGGAANGPSGGGNRSGIDSVGNGSSGCGVASEDELLVQLVRSGCVVEVMTPDFAAHGVAMGLHLFAPAPQRKPTAAGALPGRRWA